MLKGRLPGPSKKLKLALLGFGVLVVLFVTVNVAAIFNPTVFDKISSLPYSDKLIVIANMVEAKRKEARMVYPQIELLDWSFKIYDDRGNELNEWVEPKRAEGGLFVIHAAAANYHRSKLILTFKNIGEIPLHGFNAKLKLYFENNLVSEVSPFDNNVLTGGSPNFGNLDAYVPSGETYRFQAELKYPPKFDQSELEISTLPYDPLDFEGQFVSLETSFKSFDKTGIDALYQAGLYDYRDNFESGFRRSPSNNKLYLITFEIKNNSDKVIKNIKVEGGFLMPGFGSWWESTMPVAGYLARDYFGIYRSSPVTFVNNFGNSWESEVSYQSLELAPGESKVLKKLVDDDSSSLYWRDSLPKITLKNVLYLFSWGEAK